MTLRVYYPDEWWLPRMAARATSRLAELERVVAGAGIPEEFDAVLGAQRPVDDSGEPNYCLTIRWRDARAGFVFDGYTLTEIGDRRADIVFDERMRVAAEAVRSATPAAEPLARG